MLPGSACIDKAGPQAPAVAGGPYDVRAQYLAPTAFEPRIVAGAGLDLGAFEWSSITQPPAAPALNGQTAGGNQLLLSWPITASGFHLEASAAPFGPWSSISLPIVDSGSAHTATVQFTGSQFFRLAWP